MFVWQLDFYMVFYIKKKVLYFLFVLVKYFSGLPRSEEYLPEGLPGI